MYVKNFFKSKIVLLPLLFLAIFLGATEYRNGTNVKEFGAIGDGVTDDTAAVQRALNFLRDQQAFLLLARQPTLEGASELGNLPLLGGCTENTVQPELIFPAGRYRLSATLTGTSVCLRGEAGAILAMDDPAKDILYLDWAYRVRISDLEFEGGRRQIVHYTGNNDIANFVVENCVFRNSSGYALWSHNLLRPGGHDFATMTMGPYAVDFSTEIPTLTPNDESGDYYANSTLITVNNCRFEQCRGVSDMSCDGLEFADCAILMPPEFTGAAIKGAGRFRNLQAVALVGGTERWWLENTGCITSIEGGNYTVADGGGMTLVRVNREERSEVPDSLIIRDVTVDCDTALVQIANTGSENTPILIEISDVIEHSGHGAQAIQWEVPFDEARARASLYNFQPAIDLFEGAEMSRDWPFFITIFGNSGIDEAGIPAALRRNDTAPVPPELVASCAVPEVKHPEMSFATTLYATDYGVDTDFSSDDTAAMRQLFAAARERQAEGVRVVLPPVLIRISETLELPERIMLDAPGLATVRQSDNAKPIFSGTQQQQLLARHLRLVGGTDAFALTLAHDAEVKIENCFFYQQLGAAIRLQADADNEAHFRLERSTFIFPVQGVVTEAKHNELVNFWASTNGRQDREAFLVNHGGDMLVYGMLGVPMPMRDHGYNHLPFVPDWPYANDLRWIDNHSKLELRHCRFGGEYYGFVPVYQYGTGTLSIDGAYACFGFPDCRNCLVYCEQFPSTLLLRNLGWEWRRGVQRTLKKSPGCPGTPTVYHHNYLYETESLEAPPVEADSEALWTDFSHLDLMQWRVEGGHPFTVEPQEKGFALRVDQPGAVIGYPPLPRGDAAKWNGIAFKVKGDGSDNWGSINIERENVFWHIFYFPLRDTEWREYRIGFDEFVSYGSFYDTDIDIAHAESLRFGDRWNIGHNNQELEPFHYLVTDVRLITMPEREAPPPVAPLPFADFQRKLNSDQAISIVCLGDSVTAGTGLAAPDAERYATRLQERLRQSLQRNNIHAVSRGVGGAQLFDVLGWMERDLPDTPDLITLCIGYNNCSGNPDTKVFKKQLRTWIESVARRTEGKSAILLLPTLPARPPRFATQDDYAAAVRQVAAEYGLPVAPVDQALRALGPEGIVNYTSDLCHPNAAGHALLAETIVNTLLATD